jgi:hypothetical protein
LKQLPKEKSLVIYALAEWSAKRFWIKPYLLVKCIREAGHHPTDALIFLPLRIVASKQKWAVPAHDNI